MGVTNVLTALVVLNPDITIRLGVQLDSNEIYHCSNPQHKKVMGLLLHQPLSHRPSWHTKTTSTFDSITG